MTDLTSVRLLEIIEALEDRVRGLETEMSRLRGAHEALASDVVYLEGVVG